MPSHAVTQFLDSLLDAGIPGGALAVSRGKETVYTHCMGYSDREQGIPVGPDTLFRMYSVSKVVTCLAALRLYEAGRLELDDELGRYLPAYAGMSVATLQADGSVTLAPARNPIRIRHLFTMSAGFAYDDERRTPASMGSKALVQEECRTWGGRKYTTRHFIDRLASVPLDFEPGTHFQYSLGHDVLAAVIEVVTGRRFSDVLQDEVFAPLGMTSTGCRVEPGKEDQLPPLYLYDDACGFTPSRHLDDIYEPAARYEGGGNALISTLSDFQKLAMTLACGGTSPDGYPLIESRTLNLMRSDHLSRPLLEDFKRSMGLPGYSYGLGVRTMVDPQAGGSLSAKGEFGWYGMCGTWLLVDPYYELAAVYMQQCLPSRSATVLPTLRNLIYSTMTAF